MKRYDTSIIIPSFNEEENVGELYLQNKKVLEKIRKTFEIIFIDDGSTDNTFRILNSLSHKDKRIKIIRFRKNFGQTAALDAGFKHAQGRVIIAMDADLQNDPADIPKLLKKLEEGYDVVSGWRKNRKDTFMKRFVSQTANTLRKIILHDNIHDSGCTLKAYKKECFEEINLYGEMHRFIPAILEWKGFKVTEVAVKHHARKKGKTKYGMSRTIKGLLDMLVVRFWMQYAVRPMHIFGGLGIATGITGFIILLYLAYIRIILGWGVGNRPLLLLGVLLIVLSAQFIVFGLIADILIKIYYKEENNYSIERVL